MFYLLTYQGTPKFIVNFITITNFCHISTRPKNLNMNHTHIPLIKKLFCLHQKSWNSKSAHVYCLNMKPIEKRIYLTSIWDQQVRARRKLSYIRNFSDMLSLDMISNNILIDEKCLVCNEDIKIKPTLHLLLKQIILFYAFWGCDLNFLQLTQCSSSKNIYDSA